jgi:hypothetical protein
MQNMPDVTFHFFVSEFCTGNLPLLLQIAIAAGFNLAILYVLPLIVLAQGSTSVL